MGSTGRVRQLLEMRGYFEKSQKAQLGLHTFAIMSTDMDPENPVDCDVGRRADRVQGVHVDFG